MSRAIPSSYWREQWPNLIEFVQDHTVHQAFRKSEAKRFHVRRTDKDPYLELPDKWVYLINKGGEWTSDILTRETHQNPKNPGLVIYELKGFWEDELVKKFPQILDLPILQENGYVKFLKREKP